MPENDLKITSGTIIRTIIIILALVNTGLTMFGKNPIPYSSEEIEMGITYIVDIITTLIVWWKNNSFTKPALKGDIVMRAEKDALKESEG